MEFSWKVSLARKFWIVQHNETYWLIFSRNNSGRTKMFFCFCFSANQISKVKTVLCFHFNMTLANFAMIFSSFHFNYKRQILSKRLYCSRLRYYFVHKRSNCIISKGKSETILELNPQRIYLNVFYKWPVLHYRLVKNSTFHKINKLSTLGTGENFHL